MFKMLDAAFKNLMKEVIHLVYFMRGSVQYDDMMWRTPFERDLMSKFIDERIESQSKSMYPVY